MNFYCLRFKILFKKTLGHHILSTQSTAAKSFATILGNTVRMINFNIAAGE